MIDLFRAVQIPLLAGILLAATVAKLIFRESGPDTLPAMHRRRPVAVGIALSEALLAVALLVTTYQVVRYAVVVGFATATYVVSELARRRPDDGCGCFGGLSTSPVRMRTPVRAALLTCAAATTVGVNRNGLSVLATPAGWLLGLGELAVLALLSPEIGVAIARARRQIPCELRDIPLSETYSALWASEAWRRYVGILNHADPTDVWRELCHRFVLFDGKLNGKPVEVVFAVHHATRHPTVTPAVLTPEPAEAIRRRPNLVQLR